VFPPLKLGEGKERKPLPLWLIPCHPPLPGRSSRTPRCGRSSRRRRPSTSRSTPPPSSSPAPAPRADSSSKARSPPSPFPIRPEHCVAPHPSSAHRRFWIRQAAFICPIFNQVFLNLPPDPGRRTAPAFSAEPPHFLITSRGFHPVAFCWVAPVLSLTPALWSLCCARRRLLAGHRGLPVARPLAFHPPARQPPRISIPHRCSDRPLPTPARGRAAPLDVPTLGRPPPLVRATRPPISPPVTSGSRASATRSLIGVR